jgi:hypothetical protein
MVQGPLAIKDFAAGVASGSAFNIAANTAGVQIKTGSGTFLGININTVGTGGANVITLYDGLSTAGAILGIFPTTTLGSIVLQEMNFVVGLFAVLTGTTTSGNITVVYV